MTELKKAKSMVYKPLRWHIPNGSQTVLETNKEEALEKVDNTIKEYEYLKRDNLLSSTLYDYILSYWANVEGIIQSFKD